MNLSRLIVVPETVTRIEGEIDAMSPEEIRNSYADLCFAMGKLIFAANQLMQGGDPTGFVLAQGVTAAQQEAERMTEEREVWKHVEKPAA